MFDGFSVASSPSRPKSIILFATGFRDDPKNHPEIMSGLERTGNRVIGVSKMGEEFGDNHEWMHDFACVTQKQNPDVPILLLAHSMAGAIAARMAKHFSRITPIRSMIPWGAFFKANLQNDEKTSNDEFYAFWMKTFGTMPIIKNCDAFPGETCPKTMKTLKSLSIPSYAAIPASFLASVPPSLLRSAHKLAAHANLLESPKQTPSFEFLHNSVLQAQRFLDPAYAQQVKIPSMFLIAQNDLSSCPDAQRAFAANTPVSCKVEFPVAHEINYFKNERNLERFLFVVNTFVDWTIENTSPPSEIKFSAHHIGTQKPSNIPALS